MGFYFRKSISFGGFRVNLSKGGIGYSYGVKGFRISTGARGTYATIGSNGFYYRERLDKPGTTTPQAKPGVTQTGPTRPQPGVIGTADASQLFESSSEKVLSGINARKSKMPSAPFIVALSVVLAILLGNAEGAGAFLIVTFLGTGLTLTAYRLDSRRRTTSLIYELDGELATRFADTQKACEALSKTHKIWRVESKAGTWDWKRNAGATSLVTRRISSVSVRPPPFIETNVDVWGIDTGTVRLYFLPDYLFVFQNGLFGAVSYQSLRLISAPSRFIEDGFVPHDAQVVGYTWQYVRKDGGPDRRFSNNRQLSIALYAHLEVTSTTGLNIHFQVSNMLVAQQFAGFFDSHRPDSNGGQRSRNSTSSRTGKSPPPSTPGAKEKTPHEVLGVASNATIEEITNAYRQMARMYHPDKVASLAPEFRELAERRMKEINKAYETLKP